MEVRRTHQGRRLDVVSPDLHYVCQSQPSGSGNIKTRAHVIVSGRVQGVFFRAALKREAEDLGVKGWVRNLEDGSVEAVFEGEEDLVKMLVDYCRRGPPGARVSKVEASWEPYTGQYKDFSIAF